MKRALPSLFLFCIAISIAAPSIAAEPAESTIAWRVDYEKAKAEAQENSKPLLIEFYSKGCGWCKEMENVTYPDRRVAESLARDVVPLRVTGDKAGLKTRYGARGTPHTLFVDPQSGALLLRVVGFKPPIWYQDELTHAQDRWNLFQADPFALALLTEADVALRAGELQTTIDKTTTSIDLYPESSEAYRCRAEALIQLGRSDEAIADLDAAIKLSRQSPDLYMMRGSAHYNVGDFRSAIVDFQRSLRLRPGNASYTALQLWCSMVAAGHTAAADRYIKHYIKTHEYDRSEAWYHYLARFAAGEVAEDKLLAYGKRPYQKVQAYRIIGTQALVAGDKLLAKTYFEKAKGIKLPQLYSYQSVVADLARWEDD